MPNRREFVKMAGAASVASTMGLAGCTGGGGDGGNGNNTDSGGGATTDGGGGSQDYPVDTVEYIVPFSAGGGTDTYARQIMGEVSNILDINVQVTNVPGGASLRGTGRIMNGDNDGSLMGGFNPPSTPLSYLIFQPDYDLKNIEGVCTYATTPYILLAGADTGVEDLDGLIEGYNNGDFTAVGGCQSKGGLNHVGALIMQSSWDMQWENYVGYDGCAPAGQAVASGEIAATMGSDLALEGVVEAGNANPVAVLTSDGSDVFPDTPPATEQGYENIDYVGALNRGMWMPPGTPQDVIETMSSAVEEAMQTDALQSWSEESGNGLTYGPASKANDLLQNTLEQLPERVDIEAIREQAQS